jgi:hypothetical protein
MSFYDDILFPAALAEGSAGGPSFGNVIQETPSGTRAVIQRRLEPQGRWDLSLDRPPKELAELLRFARVVHGSLHGFRFVDFNDFTSAPDGLTAVASGTASHRHVIGTGDGSATRFPIQKLYAYGSRSVSRRIRKPLRLSEAQEIAADVPGYFESGTPATEAAMHFVWQNSTLKTLSTHYSIDYETGEVVFVSAPTAGHAIEWAGYFAVPVRFGREADELLSVTRQSVAQSTASTVSLIEDTTSTAILHHERDPGGASTWTAGASDAQRLIAFANGRLQIIQPDAASASPLPCKVPAEAEWMLGGPLFTVRNSGAVDSLALQTSAGAAIATIAPGELVDVFLARDAAGTGWDWVVA